MNRYMWSAAGMVAFALYAGLAMAQPAGGPGGPPPRGPDPILRTFDTDKDGTLSAQEIADAPAALKLLDANGDGKITRDEMMPPPPPDAAEDGNGDRPPPPPPPGPNPILRLFDTNRDGELSGEEIAGAAAALLKLDKDGDGALTRDELRPPPPLGPVMQALDTNKDGVLSAEEIAAAPQALLTLDKNGDGKLTQDELMPAPQTQPTQLTQPSVQASAKSKSVPPMKGPRR